MHLIARALLVLFMGAGVTQVGAKFLDSPCKFEKVEALKWGNIGENFIESLRHARFV